MARDNIIPLDPAHVGSRRLRSVRPMTGAQIVSLTGDTGAAFQRNVRPRPPELHRQVADLDEWLNRGRRNRIKQVVTVAALIVAWFCLIYFSWQLGRDAL